MRKSKYGAAFVLPVVLLFSFVVLTLFGHWLFRVTLTSRMGQSVVWQKVLYIEAKSLVPLIQDGLASLSSAELDNPSSNYLELRNGEMIRWSISREARKASRIPVIIRAPTEPNFEFRRIINLPTTP